MNKIVATILIAVSAMIPTFAAAENVPMHRFTRDGQSYVFTVVNQRARQVIDGHSETDGSRFHLIVRDGMVSGMANGQQVSFRVPAGSLLPIETAAR